MFGPGSLYVIFDIRYNPAASVIELRLSEACSGRNGVAKKIRGVMFEENNNNSMGLEFVNLSHRFGFQSPNWPYFEDVKIERIHYHAKSGVLSQRITTSIQQLAFNVAGGSNDSNRVARLKRGRLDARDGRGWRHRDQTTIIRRVSILTGC